MSHSPLHSHANTARYTVLFFVIIIHTHSYTNGRIDRQHGVQCLAQGHFDIIQPPTFRVDDNCSYSWATAAYIAWKQGRGVLEYSLCTPCAVTVGYLHTEFATASFVQHGRIFIRFWRRRRRLWVRWTSFPFLARVYRWGAPGKEAAEAERVNSWPENNRPMLTGGVLVDDVYLCQQRRNAFVAPIKTDNALFRGCIV